VLDQQAINVRVTGVLGADPRSATAPQGEAAIKLAIERIALSVRALQTRGGAEILRELYARRRTFSEEYVDRYFRGSWENAITAWWREQK
jgi:hypothetical protein